MPSLPASAKPRIAALRVCEDETLIAGYANEPAFARSSMSAYTSGVAMGMVGLLRLAWRRPGVAADPSTTPRTACAPATGLMDRSQAPRPRSWRAARPLA